MDIEPLLGRPSFVDIYLSAPLYEPWEAKVEGPPARVHRLERLPVQEALPHLLRFGATAAVAQAALHLALPRGELWRVHFAAPLTQPTRLRVHGALRPPLVPLLGEHLPLVVPGASAWTALAGVGVAAHHKAAVATRWDVPVLFLPSVHQQEGEIVVRGGGQRIESVRGHGFAAMATPIASSVLADSASLPLRLEPAESAWPQLELRTRRTSVAPADGALCESSELTTCVESDGTLSHLLRVRLRNWHEPRFTVIVPAAVQGLAAKIDGSWVDRLETEATPAGTRFALPVNPGAAVQQVELLYSSPAAAGPLLGRIVEAPAPVLPREALVQRRYWRVPADWVPLDRDRWRRRGEPDGVRAEHALAALPANAWHAGQTLLPPGSFDSTAQEAQRDDLRKAESQVRVRLGANATLGEALDRLAAALPAAVPLVVDVEALRAPASGPRPLCPPTAPACRSGRQSTSSRSVVPAAWC